MSTPNQPAGPTGGAGELPSLVELIAKIKAFLAVALRSNHPSPAEREATILYKESEESKHRTDAVVAGCLSDWHSLLQGKRWGKRCQFMVESRGGAVV